jgi:hypothetical protein
VGGTLAVSAPGALGEDSLMSTAAAHQGDEPAFGVGAISPLEIDDYEQWIGREVEVLGINPPRSSWSSITGDSWSYEVASELAGENENLRVQTWIPMGPPGSGSLTAGARGEYDHHYRTLAENLVEMGLEDASLRIAPEFTGKWSADYAGDNPDAWKEFWRRIVSSMRSVEGSQFRYNWAPTNGKGPMDDPRDAYPGDEYVSEIGLSCYDATWQWGDEGYYPANCGESCRRERQKAVWQHWMDQSFRLDDWSDFADAHGKPLTFPEWGASIGPGNHGGGDNPYFIRKMYEFMQENNVAWHTYFAVNTHRREHRLRPETNMPNAAAEFKRLFGDG